MGKSSDPVGGSKWFPVVRQQLTEAGDGVLWDAREHVAEPGERLHPVPLAHGYEAQQYGCGLAAIVATEKHPIATADGDVAVGPLSGAVVDLQIAARPGAGRSSPAGAGVDGWQTC
jgi:hypothetical protein